MPALDRVCIGWVLTAPFDTCYNSATWDTLTLGYNSEGIGYEDTWTLETIGTIGTTWELEVAWEETMSLVDGEPD